MKLSESKSTKLISGKVFFSIMVLLTIGFWAALFAVANQDWLLPMVVGMLLTFLSFYEIGRYIKIKQKN